MTTAFPSILLLISSPLAGEVLLVGDVLHPLDELAVKSLLDGDVRHCRCRCGAMPVLVVRWAPDHVARADFDDRLALALRPTASGGDDQSLTQRVCVPGGACARLKGDARARDTGRLRRGVQRINTDVSGEVVGGSFLRRLRPGVFQFHGGSLSAYVKIR